MLSKGFRFERPKRVEEVLKILAEHGDGAKVLAGGQSLVPIMNLGLFRPEVLVSINHVPDLAYIREEGGLLKIGARATHAMVAKDPVVKKHCPALAEAAAHIGDVQIRHRGTMGGSIAHADPAADYLPILLMSGARVLAVSVRGQKEFKAEDFFAGILTTKLEPDELLSEIQIPIAASGTASGFCKLVRVEGSFAIVCAAAQLAKDERGYKDVRVALGGVGPVPVLVRGVTKISGIGDDDLKGVQDAAYEAAKEATGDLSGSAEYRRAMARIYAVRAIRAAAAKLS